MMVSNSRLLWTQQRTIGLHERADNFLTSWEYYSPQITSWSPQEMRVLRQCKVPRVEVMFVTVQRENIRPSKKEMNKVVTMLPNWLMFSVTLWITTSLIADQKGVFRPPVCFVLPPHCTKDVYTPQGSTRDLSALSASQKGPCSMKLLVVYLTTLTSSRLCCTFYTTETILFLWINFVNPQLYNMPWLFRVQFKFTRI
jgi:hypothetical protein